MLAKTGLIILQTFYQSESIKLLLTFASWPGGYEKNVSSKASKIILKSGNNFKQFIKLLGTTLWKCKATFLILKLYRNEPTKKLSIFHQYFRLLKQFLPRFAKGNLLVIYK